MTDLITKWLPGRDSLYAFVASCLAWLSITGAATHVGAVQTLARGLGALGAPSHWCVDVESWVASHTGLLMGASSVVMVVALLSMNGFDGYFTRASSSWVAATAVMVEVGHWSWWAALVCVLARAGVAGALSRDREQGNYVVLCAGMALLDAPMALWVLLCGQVERQPSTLTSAPNSV